MKNEKSHFYDLLWDLWCIVSILGIWPRFIEPNILSNTKVRLPIPGLLQPLDGLKIAQISDLHLHPRIPQFFLDKLIRKINKNRPDIIVMTGDFLCNSRMNDPIRLKNLLNHFQAPLGCYAILGNHDYQEKISINTEGSYDVIDKDSSMIGQGFQRLFTPVKLSGKTTACARALLPNADLVKMLKETPFELLDNRTKLIKIKDSFINITGVGEHMVGRCLPKQAFEGYDSRFPGIVLAHNPDCIPDLTDYPGELILCGHTHGAQINLPWMWRHFTLMENIQFKRGLIRFKEKWVYVNRGIGSVMPFRWFSSPETALITLYAEN